MVQGSIKGEGERGRERRGGTGARTEGGNGGANGGGERRRERRVGTAMDTAVKRKTHRGPKKGIGKGIINFYNFDGYFFRFRQKA